MWRWDRDAIQLTSTLYFTPKQVWEIPEGGLTENLTECIADLQGHQRRVGIVQWHPTCAEILASAGFDYTIFIWNTATNEAINQIDVHSDTIYCMDWNWDGSLLTTTSKDKVSTPSRV